MNTSKFEIMLLTITNDKCSWGLYLKQKHVADNPLACIKTSSWPCFSWLAPYTWQISPPVIGDRPQKSWSGHPWPWFRDFKLEIPSCWGEHRGRTNTHSELWSGNNSQSGNKQTEEENTTNNRLGDGEALKPCLTLQVLQFRSVKTDCWRIESVGVCCALAVTSLHTSHRQNKTVTLSLFVIICVVLN